MKKSGEKWSSQLGVILAVAGSAVGIGNYLRFPGQAAQYGGGAFMIAYFVSLVVIGLSIGWAEWTMGRYAGQHGFNSVPGVFHAFMRQRWSKYIGILGLIIPLVIYMYYVIIESWCLGYSVNFLLGNMHLSTPAESGNFFGRFAGAAANGSALSFSLQDASLYLIVVFVVNFILIYRGLAKGIEVFCNFAMPTLLVLSIVVLIRVLTLGMPDPALPDNSINNGLGFMWNPTKLVVERQDGADWKVEREILGQKAQEEAAVLAASDPSLRVREIGIVEQLRKPQLWLAAAGQIFFTLSVGFGVIITYASYLGKNDDIVLSSLTATTANEFSEVAMGGLIALPAGVAFLGVAGLVGQSTFGLGFNVLPLVFSKMPAGWLFGFCFFFLLFLAAMTSSLSMLQPGIAFLEEALQIGRKQSVALLGGLTAMGCGFVFYFSQDLKALDTLDFWVGTFLIFVFGTIQIITFTWIFGVDRLLKESDRGAAFLIPRWFGWVMKYITPAFLLIILTLWILIDVLGVNFAGGAPKFSSYVQDLFIKPNHVAWMSIVLVTVLGAFLALLIARAPAYRSKPKGFLPKSN